MTKLYQWTAARSGATMTIEGIDNANHQPCKLTRIDRIGFSAEHDAVVALDAAGEPVAELLAA